jgi:GNAT superfamily N-acetyltransferase
METETKATPIIRVVQLDSECWQFRAQNEAGEVMASISLRCLAECPCVAIMFHLTTLEQYRRQGLAELLEREVESFARRKAIGLLISTVRIYNWPCRKMKDKLGYLVDCQWNNPRTGNDLVLYRKVLNPSLES